MLRQEAEKILERGAAAKPTKAEVALVGRLFQLDREMWEWAIEANPENGSVLTPDA